MTLTTRLSLFFLITLAVVLAGFSTTLYLLAWFHLHRQAEERLEAALDTLAAAVEVGPDGVEWEPAERQLALPGSSGESLIWLVNDPEGRMVDRSVSADAADFPGQAADHLRESQQTLPWLNGPKGHWQFGQRWVRRAIETGTPPRPEPAEAGRKYPALSITVGLSLEPVRATLRWLAAVLGSLSLGLWLVALVAGRAMCRRALRPVSRMAASAREMDATDLDRRLPAVTSADELEDLCRCFNSLLDRLQESFERQRRFTGDASHQLRTPLTAMRGQVEVALRRERPAEEYRRTLTSVQQQAERLGRIVESLLFLARADAEASLPDRELVDLREWLAGHLGSWAHHPRAGDLHRQDEGSGRLWVRVQVILLGELVNVLLDNACKYSPAARPITVLLGGDQQGVELSVRDEGPGIGEEDLTQLFRPFFRSTAIRLSGVEGLGLGLAVATRLAEALGGTLTVRSSPGQGSCFTLRLPRAGKDTAIIESANL